MLSGRRARRWLLATGLCVLSLGLHAMLLGGLAGRMRPMLNDPVQPERRVTEVSLLPPPRPVVAAPDAQPVRTLQATVTVRPAMSRPAPVPVRQSGAVDWAAVSTQPSGPTEEPSPDEESRSQVSQSESSDAHAHSDQSDPTRQAAIDASATSQASVSQSVLDRQQPAVPSQEPAQEMPSQPVASLPSGLAGDPSAFPALPPLSGSHARRFKVYWGDFEGKQSVARIRYRLTVEGDQYEVRTEGEAEGLISLVYSGTLTQISSGTMGPSGLVPLRYAESRGRSAVRSVGFDPEASQLLPPGAAPLNVPRGIQDRLSVFYQLGLMARAQPAAFAPGQEVVVPVASLRDMRLERFQVVGDEVLMVPGSPMRALHLHRPPPAGSRDPKIDLWLGYDQQMLPVRLRVEDSSQRVLDQLVDSGE